ncbi:MAG: PH domain-containing protein [Solirubrobacteraceae bacterium]
MELHPGERVVFEGHPSWRALMSFYLRGLLVAVALGALAALVTAIGGGVDVAIVVLVVVVAFAGVVVAGLLVRMATTYTITNQRLHIRRGVLSRREQQARLERVQNVNTLQTPVDRLLRVGKVEFDTAGSDEFEFAFVGVDNPSAVVTAVDKAQREHQAELAASRQGAAGEPAPGAPSPLPDDGL